mgnify:CR=1 FL=1
MNMEKKDIFQDIQNIRSSNPVIVLGSGASVSYEHTRNGCFSK